MSKLTVISKPLALVAVLLLVCASSQAQEPVSPKPETAAPAPADQSPQQPPQANDQTATLTGIQQKYPTYYVPVEGKKNKFEYVGPKTVVELAPTPMLDEEGRQRVDPDGKLMFNPPVRQQRDKKGNPVFDEHGKPVMQRPGEMGFDDKGKKIHEKKEKPPKMVSVSVERGTLTVDGMTGKAGMNYEIKNLKFIYLYAPWIGITIVSNSPFPGSTMQKAAFNDKTLTVTVEDHTLQLYSDKRFFKKPENAFVAVDRNFKLPSKFPVVGYGETLKPPYAWPGSRENAALKGPVPPPPLPPSLRPVGLLAPCPPGQMRMPGKTPLPGEVAAFQPCVPIEKVVKGTVVPAAPTPAPKSADSAQPATTPVPAAPATPKPAESAAPPAPTAADASTQPLPKTPVQPQP